jgi:hypothetical protein
MTRLSELEAANADLRRKLDEAEKALAEYEGTDLATARRVMREERILRGEAETRLASAVGALEVYAAKEHWDNDDDDEQRRCFVWLCHETGPDEFGGSLARAALASHPVEHALGGAGKPVDVDGPLMDWISDLLLTRRSENCCITGTNQTARVILRHIAMEPTAQPDSTLPPGVVPGPTGATTGATPATDEVERPSKCARCPLNDGSECGEADPCAADEAARAIGRG